MRVTRGTIAVIAATLLAGALAPGVSGAQPGKERREERRDERQDRREERREERQDRREERRDERQDRREERREERQERRQDRRENRQERRRAARRAIIDKWGPIYKRAPVRAELAIHARRTARLTYMKTLATEAGNEELSKRIDTAISNENARHERRMEMLKSQKGDEQ